MVVAKNRLYSIGTISYFTGYIILGVAVVMTIPVLTALINAEWSAIMDFLISMSITTIVGITMILFGKNTRDTKAGVNWKHGFVVASLTWIIAMVLCAIPFHLSGNTKSFLDACFDVMSGFTTTGIVLTQNLDHLSVALNMWRHMLTFIGGQGIIVLALTFLVKEVSGAYKIYVGEGKDIALVPNVRGTARIIWKISMVYLVVGTIVLWINGMLIGLDPIPAFYHGLYMFESAWSTGGFAPMSQNVMYYHSLSYEIVTMVIFIIGSFNFGIHYAIWQGKYREIRKNIEIQSFFITSLICSALAVLALSKTGLYTDAVSMFRRVVYSVLSAHTTTGLGSLYARQFALQWGDFGILVMAIAMMIGGSACSTAGGFKGLRVGIVFKGLISDIKKMLTPERSMKVYKFHHIKDYVLTDSAVKSAALIIICYTALFAGGTLLGVFYGYPLADSVFETASATGNVGLSIGLSTPSMPTLLKIYYMIAMYLGRLEFLSVFALIGFVMGGVKKLCKRS